MTAAEDPLVDCPLDVVHRIRKSRMQVHLVRCLKNHSLSGKLKCPYNPIHIVEAVEIMSHCLNCPDSVSVQLDQFDLEGEKCFSGEITLEEHRRQLNAALPENNEWERYTTEAAGYDPKATIESKPVIRTLIGESKAKRKQFRLQERKRHAALEESMAACSVSKTEPSTSSASIQESSQTTIKPLRRPYSVTKAFLPPLKDEIVYDETKEEKSNVPEMPVVQEIKEVRQENYNDDKTVEEVRQQIEKLVKVGQELEAQKASLFRTLQFKLRQKNTAEEKQDDSVTVNNSNGSDNANSQPVTSINEKHDNSLVPNTSNTNNSTISYANIMKSSQSSGINPKCAAKFNNFSK